MITKIAADSPDKSFESSFFSLAYSKLQEKLYNLLPFLVGFEVVKKSDDNTKALGVFGFKANNGQILFVPAFFVNGAVKDLDILYNKNNEQFYPLNEDWAFMFLKDEGTGIGAVSESDRTKMLKDTPPVDFRNFVIPPRTGKITMASVVDYVKDSDPITKKAVLSLMEDEKNGAEFTEALLRFYPIEKIGAALAINVPDTALKTDVEVIRPADKDKAKKLTSDQKQKLFSQGYLITDKRPNEKKSKMGVFQFVEKLHNPDKSGFCNYLTKGGKLAFGIVLQHPLTFQLGLPAEDTTLIKLDEDGNGFTYQKATSHIWVKDQLTIKNISEFTKTMVEPAEGRPGQDTYILINENLKSTVPFRIVQNFTDGDGLRQLVINEASHENCPTALGYGEVHKKMDNHYYDTKPRYEYGNKTLVFTKKSSDTITFRHNMAYIPKGFKLLKVDHEVPHMPFHPDEKEEARKERQLKFDQQKENFNRSAPGCLYAINDALVGHGVFPFTLRVNGSEYFADIKSAKKRYTDPISMKIAMVTDFGADEKEAEEVVDLLNNQTEVKGYIKFAYTGDTTLPLVDEAPWSNELGQPTTSGIPYQQFASQADGYKGDPTKLGLGVMPDVQGMDASVRKAIQLANSGQKELFDTQTIATLAKYVNPSDKILGYVPSFVDSLDKMGRMIFLMHWDTDKFKEMFGRDELPELMEMLRNVFKNMGELVIFMKRKFPDVSINSNEQTPMEA